MSLDENLVNYDSEKIELDFNISSDNDLFLAKKHLQLLRFINSTSFFKQTHKIKEIKKKISRWLTVKNSKK